MTQCSDWFFFRRNAHTHAHTHNVGADPSLSAQPPDLDCSQPPFPPLRWNEHEHTHLGYEHYLLYKLLQACSQKCNDVSRTDRCFLYFFQRDEIEEIKTRIRLLKWTIKAARKEKKVCEYYLEHMTWLQVQPEYMCLLWRLASHFKQLSFVSFCLEV